MPSIVAPKTDHFCGKGSNPLVKLIGEWGSFQRIDSTGSAQIHIGRIRFHVTRAPKRNKKCQVLGVLFDMCTIILFNWISALITMVCEAVGER